MSNPLFPAFPVPSDTAEQNIRTRKYGRAPLFDFEKGDFVMNGACQPVYGDGYDAWVLWCTKTIMTQRWAHLGYGSNAGIESAEAFAEPDREAVQSTFERTITEALLADPAGRTQYVRDFRFTWEADSLHLSCLVVGNEGQSATIQTKLKGG
jgi:hypothetical protein